MKKFSIALFQFMLIMIGFFGGIRGAEGASNTAQPIQKVPENIPSINALSKLPQAQPTSAVQPQPVDFGVCTKVFKMDNQKLFYLTLAAINANRFKIEEIQTKSAYVVFTAAQKQFLASIITIDAQTSMLKITPCSNIYFFPVGIVQNMFKYIELNINTSLIKLVVL